MGAVQWGQAGGCERERLWKRRDGSLVPPRRQPDDPRHVGVHGTEEARRMERAGTWGSGRIALLWPLLWLIWLPNLAVPVVALFHARPSPVRAGLALADLALFIALYLWASWHNGLSRAVYPTSPQVTAGRWRWLPVALLAGLSTVLVLADGPRWLVMLIFTGACAGGRFALGRALQALAAVVLLTALLGLLTHDSVSDVGPALFWTSMAGVLTVIVSYLRLTNRALQVAREEIARLAVEAERTRFARDLHDLLGHDLARIALQSEVVEALIPTAPERAAATAREMGASARTALQEVRAAVAGYRQPTLASELRGAEEILSAAGIAYRHEGGRLVAPPAVEAVLAWAVREGVTNVIRHSRARRCVIRMWQEANRAGIEVSDDGHGLIDARDGVVPVAQRTGGSGLAGLAERAAALGGHCEAGPRSGGGFTLSVVLPMGKDAGPGGDAVEQTVGAGIGDGR